jgi:hypothetical protein
LPPVASWPRQVALIHRSTHRPWRAIGRRSGACHRHASTSPRVREPPSGPHLPQPTSLVYISKSLACLACTRTRPEPRHSAIGAARCEPPSSRRPHPRKLLSPSLCTTKAPRVAC